MEGRRRKGGMKEDERMKKKLRDEIKEGGREERRGKRERMKKGERE